MKSHGYAAHSPTSGLSPYAFDRRDPGPNDVVLDIDFCGVCHSDIHQVRDEWHNAIYPMVPGHEIVGHVAKTGASVTKFKEGDIAAIGVMVDSCRVCPQCLSSNEPYCTRGFVGTYNSKGYDGVLVHGGYANNIVCDARYVHTISPRLNSKLAAVAPLLCAGITTYSPLRHWNAGPGKKVGVIGLGGLGHMALKFAHSFGAHVVQFTTSAGKVADALKLGADEVVLTKDPDALAKHTGSFDLIVDCVSAPHDVDPYLALLGFNGTLCLVGLPESPVAISPFAIIANRRSFSGSMIGGMHETQSMLDYCADHDLVSEIELISIQNLEDAYTRVVAGDVKYRFVIDLATLKT